MIEYTFFGPVMPSKKNGKQKIRRGGREFWVPSKAYTRWEKAHVAALMAKFGQPKLPKFRLEIWPYYVSNIVRDTDNTLTSVLDCLKKAGIIKDDSWQCQSVQPIVHQPTIDKVNPRVEIRVYGEARTEQAGRSTDSGSGQTD